MNQSENTLRKQGLANYIIKDADASVSEDYFCKKCRTAYKTTKFASRCEMLDIEIEK